MDIIARSAVVGLLAAILCAAAFGLITGSLGTLAWGLVGGVAGVLITVAIIYTFDRF